MMCRAHGGEGFRRQGQLVRRASGWDQASTSEGDPGNAADKREPEQDPKQLITPFDASIGANMITQNIATNSMSVDSSTMGVVWSQEDLQTFYLDLIKTYLLLEELHFDGAENYTTSNK
ncbi:hypothetical protein EJB05_46488 [Eragrostis curvula]|uniref:Uncharacterized protein n=1 Tax=Eragrostis curvula TaxID=38414 RepID=A0A5J9TN48_9POAL|nr:hypothetical protein EJB05_46488 [Eragrostis curvula]